MVADADAISDAEGDGTAGVDVETRRNLVFRSNPPATATASAVATPADTNGITERGGGRPAVEDAAVPNAISDEKGDGRRNGSELMGL